MITDIAIVLLFTLLRLPLHSFLPLDVINPLLLRAIADILIIIGIYLLLRLQGNASSKLLGWNRPRVYDLLYGSILALILFSLSLVIVTMGSFTPPYTFFSIQIYHIYILLFITTCTEELFFRAYLLNKLIKSNMHIIYALVINGLVFGLSHISMGLGGVLFSALSGIILGYGVYKYNSITIGVVGHYLYNAIVYTLFLIE